MGESPRRTVPAELIDRSAWDWYAESCSCGLPPGECRAHPRARPSQRPPAGDWRVWAYVAGRGAGKTRAGACWIQHRVDAGIMKLGCLIAPTAADIRDVMVEGPSGLIAVAPPWSRPRFESSKRRVEWPNGARAVCLSGEEPERARGLNIDTLWADELACWQRAEVDLGPGDAGAPGRHQSPGLDHDNAAPARGPPAHPRRGDHRPDDRFHATPTRPTCRASSSHRSSACMRIPGWAGRRSTPSSSKQPRASGLPASTRPAMSRSRPSTTPDYFVRCAIDAGTSRHTAAVFFQVRSNPGSDRPRVTVFADYHALDVVSQKNAHAIKELAHQLPCHGRIDQVRSTRPRRLDRRSARRPTPSTSGCSARASSPGGRSTWSWTGSTSSRTFWKPAT